MASNDFDDVPRRVRVLEGQLADPSPDLVVRDRAELARLPGAVETWRAGLALVAGDLPGAIAHAERAVQVAAEGDDLTVAAAAALTGLASWAGGDIPAAHRGYAAALRGLTRAGHITDVLGCSLAVADMELALGRLRDAERTLDHAVDLAEQHRPPGSAVMRGTADMLVALSRAAWHRNDLGSAADLLRRADDLGESAGLPQNPYRWRVAMARLRVAAGDHATALELLEEAERLYVGDFSPQVHPVHATRARVLAAAGDLAAAAAWAREHGVSHDDDLSYLREYEHVTLARVLLAEHRATSSSSALRTAADLLDRLLTAADAGSRAGTVLEVQVLRTLALREAGEPDLARAALEHAVDLAEPDGWVRCFVDAGPPVAEAVAELAAERPTSAFVRRLREAVAPPDAVDPDSARSHGGPGETLLDPLSDRELEVLRLLRSDLDGPAIARELVVSLNTVRTHTKHIYTKLGVNNRRSAITKGHQLGLLSRTSRG
jgi:LuxR family maltose regulon positive regulatory protein